MSSTRKTSMIITCGAFALALALLLPTEASADCCGQIPDISAACACDRDCVGTFGPTYRCNSGVCTLGGSGTPCDDSGVKKEAGSTAPDGAANPDTGAGTGSKDDGGCAVGGSSEGLSLTLLLCAALLLIARRRRG